MNLLQIVPGLPPRVDGIGDYSLELARWLRRDHGVESRFLVADPAWIGEDEVAGFGVECLGERTARALAGVLDRAADQEEVLLQMSVYGYERRGCPFWLVEGLESWCAGHPGRLHIAFHELEVHGTRPWSSTFWVPPLQRRLLRRVAALGRFRYTNTEEYRGSLERWGVGRVTLIPNFSTIGEPASNVPFGSRRREVVVFGRGAQRRWSYGRGGVALASLCRAVNAERIVDIGEPLGDHQPASVGGVPVEALGQLPAAEVSARMAKATASFLQYPVPLLTKSSVHAVSCAHGTLPFVYEIERLHRSCPGLITGEDFVPVGNEVGPWNDRALEAASERLFANYQQRSARMAAKTVAHGIRTAEAGLS